MCWGCVSEYAADEYGNGAARELALARVDERVVAAAQVCRDLYELPGCSAGGPMHVVIDDTNVEDQFVTLDNVDEWSRDFDGFNEMGSLTDADVERIRAAVAAVVEALLPLTLVERATATVMSHDLEASA